VPPRPPNPLVARPGGGHGGRRHPRRHPRPAQRNLPDRQRLPNGPGQRRRHRISRPNQPPHQPPHLRQGPPGPPAPRGQFRSGDPRHGLPTSRGGLQPRTLGSGPPEGERSRPVGKVPAVVHSPGQGREQGDQAEAVEGGVVAGDGQAGAGRADHDPQWGLSGQVEAVEQGLGVQRVSVDDQGLRGRAGVPGLALEAGAGHGDRMVERFQPVLELAGGGGEGGGGHHHPGGPAVGEAKQGQGVGRGWRRQHRPGGYLRSPGPSRRPSGPVGGGPAERVGAGPDDGVPGGPAGPVRRRPR
jgi:hypothetical protein